MDSIANTAYLQARQQPRPGETLYLCLSDLELALESVATTEPLAILDFGCGGSPYRGLFPNAQYARADIDAQQVGADYTIGADGRVPVPDGVFDLILSTQVLEHVPDPATYLAEAHRLLKPGGRLILTTHGTFDEHGCPDDFHRWTLMGLERLVTAAGFQLVSGAKLTTSLRSLHSLLDYWMMWDRRPRGVLLRIAYSTARVLYRMLQPLLHRLSDAMLKNCRIVPGPAVGHRIYIGLLVVARKP